MWFLDKSLGSTELAVMMTCTAACTLAPSVVWFMAALEHDRSRFCAAVKK